MGIYCSEQDRKGYGWMGINSINKRPLDLRDLSESQKYLLQNNDISRILVKKSNYEDLLKKFKGSQEKWKDPEFLPEQQHVGDLGLSFTPAWKRIPEVIRKPSFMIKDFESDDILKGQPGQCYMLSAVSAVAENPSRIRRIFASTQNNPNGIYMVRLMQQGQVREVVVDDYIPLNQHNEPIFVQPKDGEFWPLIVEKAFAKLYGSYANILEGRTHQVLRAITFSPTSVISIKNFTPQQLLAKLKDALKREHVLCACTALRKGTGLPQNKSLTLLAIESVHANGQTFEVVKLRNPSAEGKIWRGRCSAQDHEFWSTVQHSKVTEGVQKQTEKGIFLIPYEQFIQKFQFIDIAEVDEKLSHNCIDILTFNKRAAYFQVKFDHSGPARLVVTQPLFKLKNRLQPSRVRIVVAKQVAGGFEYVNSMSSGVLDEACLNFNQVAGVYVVYAKVEWEGSIEQSMTLSVQSRGIANISEKFKKHYPEFLNKVFMNHAINSPDKQYFSETNHSDWIVSKLLLQEAALGYIACKIDPSSNRKVTLKINRQFFNQEGFTLKNPYKMGSQQLVIEASGDKPEVILIGKLKRGSKRTKLTFPPDIEVFYE